MVLGSCSYARHDCRRDSRDGNYEHERDRERDARRNRNLNRAFGRITSDDGDDEQPMKQRVRSHCNGKGSRERREESSHDSQHHISLSSLPPERWQRRLRDAKKAHRPRLKNWERERFGIDGSMAAMRFDALRWDGSGRERSDRNRGRGGAERFSRGIAIAREKREELSPKEFAEHYERRRLPVIVSGIPWHEGWRAGERWTFERLDRSFRESKLKCGEDDEGYSVKVKLKYFLQYMEHQRDDSPLYIFDSHFDDYDVSKPLLEDFNVPDYFPDDLFSLVGERRRPPYRWFLVGPKRSGTSVHIDPLGTSAWNTVIRGRKLWVLFPPSIEKKVAKSKELFRDDEDDEPINYFIDVLPRIRRKYGDSIEMYEFVQYPGDTVFVPGGWWHAVLNLDDTVAITQNFCSRNNFEKVWRKTRTGRKKMAVKWLSELDKEYPTLGATARRLNAEDGFVMSERREKKRRQSSGGERDGDDSRGRDSQGKQERKKHSKRKGDENGSERDGEGRANASGSSRSGTNSSHKKRREKEWSDRSTDHCERPAWEDQGGSSTSFFSASACSPPTCNW